MQNININSPVSDLREIDLFGRGEKHRYVMPDDAHEERYGHDGQEHPQPDCGVEAELGIGHCDAVRGGLVALCGFFDFVDIHWIYLHKLFLD